MKIGAISGDMVVKLVLLATAVAGVVYLKRRADETVSGMFDSVDGMISDVAALPGKAVEAVSESVSGAIDSYAQPANAEDVAVAAVGAGVRPGPLGIVDLFTTMWRTAIK